MSPTLEVPDELSWKKFLDSIATTDSTATATSWSRQAVADGTLVFLPASRRCVSSSPGSSIFVRSPPDWHLTFYTRVDRSGSFHTYPHVGGPFQSLQEAHNGIDRFLQARRDPKMCKEQAGVSQVEMAIRQCLYWPDGTKKKCSKSQATEKTSAEMCSLVQALVDQYNENHQLIGDLAYELKDFLHSQYIRGSHETDSRMDSYYHLNFTANTNGAKNFDSLFFVEVTFMQGQQLELVVSCFCMVEPNDNGHCYGCINNGSVHMKHPNKSDAYTGGHLNTYSSYGYDRSDSDEEENEEAEEARIRHMYADYDVEARIVAELGLDKDTPHDITEEDIRRAFGCENMA